LKLRGYSEKTLKGISKRLRYLKKFSILDDGDGFLIGTGVEVGVGEGDEINVRLSVIIKIMLLVLACNP